MIGGEAAPHFFPAKAWRAQPGPLEALTAGRRVGLLRLLLPESYEDRRDQRRNSVVIEVVASRLK